MAPPDRAAHPLRAVLDAAVAGSFPAVDGRADILSPDADGTCAVVSFTGHAIVLTERSPEHLPPLDGYGAAVLPEVLLAITSDEHEIGSLDVVMVRRGTGSANLTGASALLATDLYDNHPRVLRARRHRREVRVLGDERGLVTIGAGLVGRTELSVELTGASPGRGSGRALIDAGLSAIADDEWVFAQVAAGNAASLRAFLACGFVAICSEVLFTAR